VFVQAFPASGGKRQVSTAGGSDPQWRRDGKELFYLSVDNKLMAVEVKLTPRFEAGASRPLFAARVLSGSLASPSARSR